MAVTSFYHVGNALLAKESLSDYVSNVAPTETPFLTMVQKTTCTSRVHNHVTDTIAARSAWTAAVEGASFTGALSALPKRITNYTQIQKESVSVSDTERAVSHVGLSDMFAYQSSKALKELATHIENILWSTQTGASGASNSASTLRGIKASIDSVSGAISALYTTTAGIHATSSGDRAVTNTLMNTTLTAIWDNGGAPEYIFCGAARKAGLIGLIATGYGTRFIPADANGEVIQTVDVYVNDLGKQTVVLSRDIASDSYAIIEIGRWALAWLTGRGPQIVPIGKLGDSTDAMALAEFTLEARAPGVNGWVEDIS